CSLRILRTSVTLINRLTLRARVLAPWVTPTSWHDSLTSGPPLSPGLVGEVVSSTSASKVITSPSPPAGMPPTGPGTPPGKPPPGTRPPGSLPPGRPRPGPPAGLPPPRPPPPPPVLFHFLCDTWRTSPLVYSQAASLAPGLPMECTTSPGRALRPARRRTGVPSGTLSN